MKHLKKWLGLALCLALLCTLVPRLSLTAHAETVSGTCGDNLTWTLDTDTGALTIKGSGKMECDDEFPWVDYRDSIKKVTIGKGITNIGDSAFADCTELKSVSIPDTVTEIEWDAFYNCSSLTSITIPGSVTYIGFNAFSQTGLTSVTIPNSVEYIGVAPFSDCPNLTKITVSSGSQSFTSDSSGVLYSKNKERLIQCPGAYKGSYSIPKNVATIESEAFLGCAGLAAVTIPDSVSTIEIAAFKFCTGLTKVTIPDSVTRIEDRAFYGCVTLTAVTIPDSVSKIRNATFAFCTGLKSITIPDSITAIEQRAFYRCSSLTSVTIPASVSRMGTDVFYRCTSLKKISVASGNEDFSSDSSGVLYNKDKTQLIKCPEGFQGSCSIPKTVTDISSNALAGCSSLTFFSADSNSSSFFTDSSGVLFDKQKQTLIQCPGGFQGSYSIPAGVKTIGRYSFECCKGLTGVTIPDSVTKILYNAFFDCDSLKNVVIPASVTDIGNMAFGWISDPGIYYDGFTTNDYFTVYGYAGSAAETWAEGWFKFVPLDPATGFADAKPGKYYYNAVLWAINHDPQITKGTDAVHFSPNQTCNRAQVVSFLWNALNKPAPDESNNPFVDVKPSKYFFKPVLWAFQNGVTKGADDTHFNPNGSCTRAQVVSFIWNALGKPEPASTDSPFVDVKPGKYYYKAVLWAVENGVTKGVDTTHFGPNQICTRGQVVTFLYNALGK